ncbi:zinc finger protein 235-like [Orussus abietinus]|uniref:zinc finger protein 235-like n=1 Tax=Orussus abietinus TaxID=222816 RepID=UPI000626DAC3|nr:zinc finger protein 235-like [Orussus abietinus]
MSEATSSSIRDKVKSPGTNIPVFCVEKFYIKLDDYLVEHKQKCDCGKDKPSDRTYISLEKCAMKTVTVSSCLYNVNLVNIVIVQLNVTQVKYQRSRNDPLRITPYVKVQLGEKSVYVPAAKEETDQEDSSADSEFPGKFCEVRGRRSKRFIVMSPKVITRSASSHRRDYSDRFCEDCGLEFTNENNLAYHRALKHSKLGPCVCPICNRTFRNVSNRRAHMVTHMGTRPYKCELCGEDFKQRSNLTRHMRSHPGKYSPPPPVRLKDIIDDVQDTVLSNLS